MSLVARIRGNSWAGISLASKPITGLTTSFAR